MTAIPTRSPSLAATADSHDVAGDLAEILSFFEWLRMARPDLTERVDERRDAALRVARAWRTERDERKRAETLSTEAARQNERLRTDLNTATLGLEDLAHDLQGLAYELRDRPGLAERARIAGARAETVAGVVRG